MKKIKELGKLIKEQYPEYNDLSDEEVGRRVKEKFPNKYNDYAESDESIPAPIQLRDKNQTFSTLLKDLIGEKNTPFTDADKLEKKVNQILQTFDPNQGWFSGWLAEKRTAKQGEILTNLSYNQKQAIDQYMEMARAVRQGKEEEINFKLFVARNVTELMNIQALAQRIEEATKKGIPEMAHTELLVADLTHKQEFSHHQEKTTFENDESIRVARSMSQIDIDKQMEIAERLSDIKIKEEDSKAERDWKRHYNEIMLDVRTAVIANLTPIAEAEAITTQIKAVIKDIAELKQLPDGYVSQEMMKTMEDTLEYLQDLVREKYAGLLQGNTRKKSERLEENEQSSES